MKRFLSQKTLETSQGELGTLLGEMVGGKPLFNGEISLETHSNITPINFQKTIPSAFVHIDKMCTFRIALHNSVSWNGRYSEIMALSNLKNGSRSSLQSSLDSNLVDSSQKREWLCVPSYPPVGYEVKFPNNEIKQEMIHLINCNSNIPLDEIIESLISSNRDELKKYSFEDITYLFVKLLGEIKLDTIRPQILNQLNEIFDTKILQFHDKILISIQQTLLSNHDADVIPVVNTINASYDINTQINDINGPFFKRFPHALINDYLITSILAKDLKTAKTLLDSLIKDAILPKNSVIFDYINLSSKLCLKLPIEDEKKVLLFNNLTSSLKYVLIKDGMLNGEVIKSISEFINLDQIDLFINYLKMNPSFQKYKHYLLRSIIKKITFSEGNKDMSMYFTGVLNKLDFQPGDDTLTPKTRNMIIHTLKMFHHPIACKLWEVNQNNK